MGLIDRAKNILLTPKTEWDVIAAEPSQPKDLVLTYVLPLAALAAICGFISSSLIGTHALGITVRTPIVWGIVGLIFHFVMAVVVVFVVAFVIDALAPSFGAQKNFNQAFKIPVYCFTASWIGAVFGIIPFIGWLIALLFAFYGIYLLYLGIPKLMKNPDEKTIAYTAVVIVVTFVLMFIVSIMAGMFMAGGIMAGGSALSSSQSNVTVDKDSRLGKLNDFAKKMEEAGKKMEAAQKSGDQKGQMEASMAALGTALSGGKGVEPVQLDALKPFVPETFAGLPRKDLRTERSGVTGLMHAKVEGVYGDETGKSARLEVTDTGGAAGLMGLATWMGIQGEREDSSHRESTRREGTRVVHEETSKTGGTNKYTVILTERFIVNAQGSVDGSTLKAAVNSLELGKIEALK